MSAAAVYGRRAELELIDAVARSTAREGSAELVSIVGDAGIGKTSLLAAAGDALARHGFQVLRTGLSEAETRLSWAGLHELCRGIDDEEFSRSSEGLRDAIAVALGRLPGATDANLVAFALGELLVRLADRHPVAVIVDDLHWLDHATAAAVAFAVRAVSDRPATVLLAARPHHPLPLEPDRLLPPERCHAIDLDGVSPATLHRIVEDGCGVALRRTDLIRLHESSQGNPLLAVQAARLIASGVDPSDAVVHPTIPTAIATQLEQLPPEVGRVLAGVALLASPDLGLLHRLEPDVDVETALEIAERSDVVRVERNAVTFRHPLIRTGVLDQLGGVERMRLARRAAELLDDVEERAELLADAVSTPDEAVALLLEEAAERAAARGAHHVAADRFERAARLTVDGDDRALGRRLLLAAEASYAAGDRNRPLELADRAAGSVSEWEDRLRLTVVRVLTVGNRPDRAGATVLARAALADFDEPLAHARLLGLISQGVLTYDIPEALAASNAAVAAAGSAGDASRLAVEQDRLLRVRFIAGEPVDLDAVERAASDPGRSALERLDLAFVLAHADRLEPAIAIYEAALGEARRSGAIDDIQLVHDEYAEALLRLGRFEEAEANWAAWDEYERMVGGTVRGPREVFRALIHSLRGRADEARSLVDAAFAPRDLEPTDEVTARSGAALVALTLGDWNGVVTHGRRLREIADRIGYRDLVIAPFRVELVEGLIHLGELDEADEVAAEHVRLAARSGLRRGVVESLRSRALVAAARGDLTNSIDALERAVGLHADWPVPFDHGRDLLALGAVLRRANRRSAAAEQLREARTIFDMLGAVPWAWRTDVEIERLGSRLRTDAAGLTPTERQIVDLVVAGRTNAEIATELSVSVRTVESNLTRVYRKLGVRSRAELIAARLRDAESSRDVDSPDAGASTGSVASPP